MLLEEISPFIRFCERYHWQNYTKFSICLDCRLFYIKNGEGEIIIDGKKCNFKKTHLFYFRRAQNINSLPKKRLILYRSILTTPRKTISTNYPMLP